MEKTFFKIFVSFVIQRGLQFDLYNYLITQYQAYLEAEKDDYNNVCEKLEIDEETGKLWLLEKKGLMGMLDLQQVNPNLNFYKPRLLECIEVMWQILMASSDKTIKMNPNIVVTSLIRREDKN